MHSLCLSVMGSFHQGLGKPTSRQMLQDWLLNTQPRALARNKQAELELIAPKGQSLKDSCVLFAPQPPQQDGKTTKRGKPMRSLAAPVENPSKALQRQPGSSNGCSHLVERSLWGGLRTKQLPGTRRRIGVCLLLEQPWG